MSIGTCEEYPAIVIYHMGFSCDRVIIFLPSAFHLIAAALVNLMKFYNDPMVIRNKEKGIPEFKTLQTLILPLLSLHWHFTDAKLFKMGAKSY